MVGGFLEEFAMNQLVEKYVMWNSVLSLFTEAIRPLMDCKYYNELAQRSKVIPGKLIVPQPDKKFPTLYGI
jgi:hypothetical protein